MFDDGSGVHADDHTRGGEERTAVGGIAGQQYAAGTGNRGGALEQAVALARLVLGDHGDAELAGAVGEPPGERGRQHLAGGDDRRFGAAG